MDAATQNEAFEAMVAAIPPIQDVEWIPLAGARGRVLAHAVRSRETGSTLLDAGERIDSGAIALLGGLGMFEVDVVRTPRAALAFDPSQRGMIAEAVAAGLAVACGSKASTAPLPPPAQVADHLRRLARAHDAIITHDDPAVAETLGEIGRIEVAPGGDRATAWAGRIGSCTVFGFPTAPGALVLAHSLWLSPSLARMEGRVGAGLSWTLAAARVAIEFDRRVPYRLGRLSIAETRSELVACADPSEVDPLSLREMNAVATGEGSTRVGDLVKVAPIRWGAL
jgi:molybdopterin biosynthesis enzyme